MGVSFYASHVNNVEIGVTTTISELEAKVGTATLKIMQHKLTLEIP